MSWFVVAALAATAAMLTVAVGTGSAAEGQCLSTNFAGSSNAWQAGGAATWTSQGLQTNSKTTSNGSLTCGFARVFGSTLPTTDPSQITALSFDFNSAQSGGSGGSPRLVVCFNDGSAGCDSNASLVPSQWAAGTWIHVDGFSPATGLNATWSNSGGVCGATNDTTWAAIVACHPGASVTTVQVVNDSGWLYPSGEQVLLDNLRVNNLFTHALPPQFGESALVVPTGHVLVKRPGSHRFRRLKNVSLIPFGAIVDATGGRIQVIAATHGGGYESGDFYDGAFHLTQGRDGYVQATLTARPSCPSQPLSLTARIASTSPHLWGHVKGHYRTSGYYGSASVRGTIWVTVELCTGTYFHVVRGVLFIRDFTRHKNVVLHAGHSYLAPSQPPDTFDHDGDYNNDKRQGLSDRRR